MTRRTLGGPTTQSLVPPLLALIAAALVFSWTRGASFHQDVAVLACAYGLTSLGMYLPFNLAGSLSLAYSAYVTLGAYAVGVVSIKTGWPIIMGWLFGMIITAIIAVFLGVVTSRLSGFYLAGVTLLAAGALTALIIDQTGLTNGAEGIHGIRQMFIGGVEMTRTWLVVVGLALVFLVALFMDRFRRSPVGLSVISTNHSPQMVEALGVSTTVIRLAALGAGAAVASLGGSLFATFNHVIQPDTFPLHFALIAIFMPMIGGAGTAWGAALGALIVTDLTVNRPGLKEYGPLIFAGLVVVILLVAPNGILGLLNRVRRFVAGRLRLGGSA